MVKRKMQIKISAFLIALAISFSLMPLMAGASPGADGLVILAALSKSGSGVSEWSKASPHAGSWSIHLKAPGKATWDPNLGMGVGVNEGRVSLKLAPGTTLGDIETIAWCVKTTSGYPPHVDLLLDIDGNGVFEGSKDDVLVAEFAYQPYVGPGYAYVDPRVPYGHYAEGLQGSFYNPPYNTWVKTFQNSTTELGTDRVHNGTILWLNSGLSGPYGGGFFGRLSDFKEGSVEVIGGTDKAPVDYSTVVLEIQIEVDNWIGSSEAYVDDVYVNGEVVLYELLPPEIVVEHPEAKTYLPGDIPVEISAEDIFGVSKIWYNVRKGDEWVYGVNRTYTSPTVMHAFTSGDYKFYAWANNTLGVVGRRTVEFRVRATVLTVEFHPETLNLKSGGRWVTVYITPPAGRTADEIDISTVRLHAGGKSIPADWGDVHGGVLMVKFIRSDLQGLLGPGEVEVIVTGEYSDGTAFQGSDTVRVISPGRGVGPQGRDLGQGNDKPKPNKGK